MCLMSKCAATEHFRLEINTLTTRPWPVCRWTLLAHANASNTAPVLSVWAQPTTTGQLRVWWRPLRSEHRALRPMAVLCQATAFGLLLTAAGLLTSGCTATVHGDGDTEVHFARSATNMNWVRVSFTDLWPPHVQSSKRVSVCVLLHLRLCKCLGCPIMYDNYFRLKWGKAPPAQLSRL